MERNRLFETHRRPEPAPIDRAHWLQQERLNSDLRAMRHEWHDTVGANAKRRGGKGGRGGV
jgi:hypothetical protein